MKISLRIHKLRYISINIYIYIYIYIISFNNMNVKYDYPFNSLLFSIKTTIK